MSYQDGRDILRDVLVVCTQHDFAVSRLRVERARPPAAGADLEEPPMPSRVVTVVLELQGARSVSKLAAKLADIDGVVSVNAGDGNVPSD